MRKWCGLTYPRRRSPVDSKELWLHALECAIEEVMDVEDVDRETASRWVEGFIDVDPSFLEDYINVYEG